MIIEEVRLVLGSPPVGYEFVEYVVVALFALMMVQSCISFISGLFRLFGGD